MSGCNGCFNGCTEVVSDQCVRYTGIDIPALGIETGDPLSTVEQLIIEFLQTALDGTGILPDINPYLCTPLVNQYLPTEGDITLVDFLTAIINAACNLQTQVNTINSTLTTLNGDYDVDCLDGITDSSDTHTVVQAVIDKLCEAVDDIGTLTSSLSQYTLIADLNAYIAAYIASTSSDKMYTKMVPYTAIEYYGELNNYPTVADGFGPTGIGFGAWENVYLCNGLNGTPDKRGRIPVGATSMRVGGFNAAVDPALGSPTYTVVAGVPSVEGSNYVTLTTNEMPAHTHVATSTVNDPGHRHLFVADNTQRIGGGYSEYGDTASGNVTDAGGAAKNLYTKSDTNVNTKESQTTGVTVSTAIASRGLGQQHSNIPPVMACYYLMYIPV